jgi:hypothetical protein
MNRHFTVLTIAIVGFTLALTEAVRGNGQEFFPAAEGKTVDLVYFGRIKDKSTGRLIRDRAFLTIFDSATGLSFPFMNDSVAHYRSPDVGAAIREMGGVKADPKNFEIQLMVAGYKDVRVTRLPRTPQGSVELNFALEPTGAAASAAPPATSEPTPASPALPQQSPWAQILAFGSVGLFIAAVMVRTLGPRSSTTD